MLWGGFWGSCSHSRKGGLVASDIGTLTANVQAVLIIPKRGNQMTRLPKLLDRKIYKTGQTRGADDDQIFQNRVGRNSTVLIPFSVWREHGPVRKVDYEKGFIVLVPPDQYFEELGDRGLHELGLSLGTNALIFYELRNHWNEWLPERHRLGLPTSRRAPLGGQYVARIANTTSDTDERINHGYTTTGLKGAGIRLFEYAPLGVIQSARTQLEAAFWHAVDAEETCIEAGMTEAGAQSRKNQALRAAEDAGLLDYDALQKARVLNGRHELVCPLCLERLSALGFMSRLTQQAGRERHDLTVTEVNLFHIKELAYGLFNHRPYNLGWGHHHCNVVCKDSGIIETLSWMEKVLDRNSDLIGKER